jgi:predicted dehydrogenase
VESYSSTLVDSANVFHGSAWRHERGALWDVGPHAVAQLCAVLGPVSSVLARRGAGDFITLTLEHATGAIGSISLAADLPVAVPGGTSLIGPRGRTSPPPIDDWNATARLAYGAALAQLADEIEHGAAAHECDLAFGAQVTRVLAAAERSAASTRPEIP